MIETGIYIRTRIDGSWESVDIGDERLTNEALRTWLQTLKPEGLVRTVMRALGREWPMNGRPTMRPRAWDARPVWSLNFGRPTWDVTFESLIEDFCQRLLRRGPWAREAK